MLQNPVDAAVDDIRAKARRAQRDLAGGRPDVTLLLVLAWIEEVNAEYDEILRSNSSERAIYEQAVNICVAVHGVGSDRQVARGTVGPQIYHCINGYEQLGALQAMMAGARPLWTFYYEAAKKQIKPAKNA